MHAVILRTLQGAHRIALRTLVGGIAAAALLPAHAATTETFRDIKVEVVSEGRPVLMIPGHNSSGETWRETCNALQADQVQCHIVTLPGFSGQPAAKDASTDLDRRHARTPAWSRTWTWALAMATT